MKAIIIFISVVYFTSFSRHASAQQIERDQCGRYLQNGKKLRGQELDILLRDAIAANSKNPMDAERIENLNIRYKKAKANFTTSYILSAIGGGLIGWGLADGIINNSKKDLPWYSGIAPWVASGLVLIGASIPFSIAGSNNTKKAVEIYNEMIGAPSLKNKMSFNLNVSPAKIGISVSF